MLCFALLCLLLVASVASFSLPLACPWGAGVLPPAPMFWGETFLFKAFALRRSLPL